MHSMNGHSSEETSSGVADFGPAAATFLRFVQGLKALRLDQWLSAKDSALRHRYRWLTAVQGIAKLDSPFVIPAEKAIRDSIHEALKGLSNDDKNKLRTEIPKVLSDPFKERNAEEACCEFATNAALAILFNDMIDSDTVRLVYEPFAQSIPLEEPFT
jgi:hypothetical protein